MGDDRNDDQSVEDCYGHPVHHITFLQLAADPNAQEIQHLLQRIRNSCAGVVEVYFGRNITKLYPMQAERTSGYTHTLCALLVHAEALRQYERHPAVVALSKSLFRLLESPPIVADFFATSHL